ncbi:unnamed protein product [Hermetia illucens]|uniref:Uncharacterized protein n=1 Tax=Hermetia illucens TaxID=343691 RepID=A0A7R8V522_HERIL|nr:unnamed protein product [Hermetia illucens]
MSQLHSNNLFILNSVKKYVSELSTVRDCATECTEKEVWETQTYCCTEDGCNGANNISTPNSIMLFLFLIFAILNVIRH